MKHLDLFSGIGGFALAVDTVWPGSEHTFVENDLFCQAILTKHWPNSQIHGDIRTFITDTEHNGQLRAKKTGTDSGTQSKSSTRKKLSITKSSGGGLLRQKESRWDILTGGFPCQPFSQAGRRKGTEDNRYLWPEMFRVIQLTKPTWVIAENVRGLVTWNDGLVLEQVCADLESEGYEVQPIIIPAVAVNALHRRDRIWIIGNSKITGRKSCSFGQRKTQYGGAGSWSTEWERNWIEVATELCRVDDGIPKRLDRTPRLKALGNAIVPQVAIEIMKSIQANQ